MNFDNSATDNSAVRTAPGLDGEVHACLFDLDGVLTRTATIHAAAWKKTFDTFLRAYDVRSLRRDRPFDEHADYEKYLDGRTEHDGIRSFLASRGVEVPEGDSEDAPGTETVHGIAAAKQWAFVSLLEVHGPGMHEGSVRYVRAVREAGLPCAVVTSGGNVGAVLEAAGIAELFDVVVDGSDAAEKGLSGKPAPDGFLYAARTLGVDPAHAAVFEDALAGVQAARAGGFGTVVGVDRLGGDHAERLRASGASIVVPDLADLLRKAGASR